MIKEVKKILIMGLIICLALTHNISVFAVEKTSDEAPSREYTTVLDLKELPIVDDVEAIIPNNIEKYYQEPPVEILKAITESDYATFAINENTDPNYAYLVENDYVVQGTIEKQNEMRWYGFVLNERSKATILLQTVEGLDADIYMFRLNGNQLELIGGSANEGFGIEYYTEALETGIYYFAISGYSGTGSFTFEFYQNSQDVNYEVNDTTSSAINISLSTDTSGVIDHPNDIDYYKFTVTKPTIIKYSISTSNNYILTYKGKEGTGAAVYQIEGNLIKVNPGTYYFAVQSPNGVYSGSSRYTINFKKNSELANDNSAKILGICKDTGMVFQTNENCSKYYVNGNPIDIGYYFSQYTSNSEGSQRYYIEIEKPDNVYVRIDPPYEPRAVDYLDSSRPNIIVPRKALLEITLKSPQPFYRIHCSCTGAYAENDLWQYLDSVTVFIDPDTGKLVDISYFNYFYHFAVGSNSINYTTPYSMTFYKMN